MRIKVLGTRGEVESSAPYHSKHSGLLVDDTVLLDLGEREFLDFKPKGIFVTHLHPDHAFFVVDPTPIDIPIYAPEASRVATGVRTAQSAVQIDSYTIVPIPTHHSKKVKSVAYLVDNGEQKLLYTGDLIWINKEYHNLFNSVAFVITEASFIRKGGMIRRDRDTGQIYGHAGVPNLIDLFKRFTRHILFIHFGNWFYKGARVARQRITKLGKKNGMNIYVGYDGMELDLDDLQPGPS
jgi:glyoxylase-like metal-dependent hydrolase (beta-lactamase superfamily II)